MISRKVVSLLTPVLLFVAGCATTNSNQASRNEMATLWYQTAAENRALQLQVFQQARVVLDKELAKKSKKGELPRAIVVDIDETVLDNVPFQASLILEDAEFPGRWQEWVTKAQAKAVPGSVEFLTYAHKKGVKVFYLTNRSDHHKADTQKNLAAAGFPDVTETTVICASGNEWSKEGRRAKLREQYRLVMLFGDNLNDFDSIYERKSVAERNAAVESQKEKFGTQYFMLPNPMYGDWEGAIYNHDFKLPPEKKAEMRRSNLKSF